MKQIENKKRDDAYRIKELDAKLMGAAHGKNDVATKICPCGSKNPAGAKFCGACGKRLVMTNTDTTE